MKAIKNLYSQITDFHNLCVVFRKAAKGKKREKMKAAEAVSSDVIIPQSFSIPMNRCAGTKSNERKNHSKIPNL